MGKTRKATGRTPDYSLKPQAVRDKPTQQVIPESQQDLEREYKEQQTEQGARKLQGKRQMLQALKDKGVNAGGKGEVRIMYNNVTGEPRFYRERNF